MNTQFRIETLETQNSDRLDFHDVAVWSIRAALERAGVAPEQVQEVIMGCVLPAGLKQGPARQAALNAGLPAATGCTTINKLCGSGMKAVMQAFDALKAGGAPAPRAGARATAPRGALAWGLPGSVA